VDVVIVSWNVRDDLLRCLASLSASEGVSTRIAVVDNASSDGSADAIAQHFPDVQLLRQEENLGFARAANLGARSGSADYVLFLNPDTLVSPDTLAQLRRHLDRLPGHAAVTPRLVDEQGVAQHSVYKFPSLLVSGLLATSADRLLPAGTRAGLLLEGSWKSDRERDVDWAIGAVLLMRRAILEEVGGFDERYFVYAEDLDWASRAARLGRPIRFTPSITVLHHGNRSGAQRYGDDRVATYSRNSLDFVRRRNGLAWTAAFVAINGGSTVIRYAGYRLLARIRPRPRWLAGVRRWRPYARFYLRRADGPR
jgi:GT2 family glycosyltransferase